MCQIKSNKILEIWSKRQIKSNFKWLKSEQHFLFYNENQCQKAFSQDGDLKTFENTHI